MAKAIDKVVHPDARGRGHHSVMMVNATARKMRKKKAWLQHLSPEQQEAVEQYELRIEEQRQEALTNPRSMKEVLADLNAVRDNCMQVYPDQFGRMAMLSAPTALKALELEGKHYGGFKEQVQVDMNINGKLVLPDQYDSADAWEDAAKTIDAQAEYVDLHPTDTDE